MAAQVVRMAGVTAVGTDASPLMVTITLSQGGSLDSVRVLTQGSPGFDFANVGGGSCAPGQPYLAGQTCSVHLGFHPLTPGERRGAVLLLDRNGTTLAAQPIAATASGPIATFVPGTIRTVAGDAAWIYSGDGALATGSALFLPFGLAVDAAGDIFIADSSNNRIRRVDTVTGLISTVAGNGLIGTSGDGGPATQAALSTPSFVTLDPAGNVFFSDSGNNAVRRIDAFTGLISTVAGTIGHHGYTGDNGAATQATLNTPNGLALDAAGNLYITDTGNNAVRLVSAATGIMTTVAGVGTAGFSGDGKPATAAALNSPWSVALSPAGELYIADQNNHRIRRLDATGIITTVFGNGNAGFAGDGGPAIQASLNEPASVAIDVAGNIYIADSGNDRIRKVSGRTGDITTIGGTTHQSFTGEGAAATDAGLYGPYSMALDGQGNLLVADVFHNRIRRIASNEAFLLYPPLRVGRVSAPLIQMLENDGDGALHVGNLVAVSNSQLNVPATNCNPANALNPFDTCNVAVDFAPTSTGSTVNGELQVTSDGVDSPGSIVLAGQVLDTDPSSVALTSDVNPSVTGSPVIYTVTVTSSGTTPTGSITLMEGTVILSSASLQNGTAKINLSSLSGGRHLLTANYPGDTSNSVAVSPQYVQIVRDAQAATITNLSSSANPATAGSPLVLTAAVAEAVAGSGNGTPSGTVTFSDGTVVLGIVPVAVGSAALSLTSLPVGLHTITAFYSGDATHVSSSSNALTERVQIATTHLALSSGANPSNAGAQLTLSSIMVSSGQVPTGTVTFFDGSVLLGSAPLNSQGVATLPVAGAHWSVGTHSLVATYAGDSGSAGSSSAPLVQVVTLASASVQLTSSANPSAIGGPVVFTAAVTGNGGTPTGSVLFSEGTLPLGSVTLNAGGVATLSLATLALGSHPISATYSGDASDTSATSGVLIQIVQQTTDAIAITSSANPSNFNAPLTLTATVTGSGSNPSGSVSFQDGATTLASVPLGSLGVASFTSSSLAIGSHNIVAQFSGDTHHAAVASTVLIERIVQTTTTAMSCSASHSVAGVAIVFSASVTGSSGDPVGGLITFSDSGSALATTAIDAAGKASFTSSSLPPGQHAITAAYLGDALDAASASSACNEIVTIASSSTTLSTSANPTLAGSPVVLSAAVTGNGATPTGSVSFRDGSQPGSPILGTVALTAGATASLSLSNLAPGIHPITAIYSGDTLDQGSTSAPLAQQIAEHTGITLTSSANPSLLSDAVTLTVAVVNGAAGNGPTGSISLSDNGVAVASSAIGAGGMVSFTLASPALGTHSLIASYAGDNNNTPASSQPLLQTVTLRPTTASFTTSSVALSAGQQLILVSVVQPPKGQAPGPQAPTGLVSFQAGTTILGTAPIDASGVATLTLAARTGTYNAVAQYTGDALYAPSTSPAIIISVGPPIQFTLTAPASLQVQSGQHTTIQIDIETAPTFNDVLALGCAGLPPSATCTFSENQVTVGGGLPKTLTVVFDTGSPLGAGASARLAPAGSLPGRNSIPMACFLPAGALLALLLRRGRHARRGLALLAMMLVVAAASALSGCASSFNINSTPPGAYTFQIVGSANHTGATQTAVVKLTVTP